MCEKLVHAMYISNYSECNKARYNVHVCVACVSPIHVLPLYVMLIMFLP